MKNNNDQTKLIWGYAFWGWIIIFIISFSIFIRFYGLEKFIAISLIAFPFIMCILFIPLFLMYDRAKFSINLNAKKKEFKKKDFSLLFMGLCLIPWGYIYYIDEWDYKYGFRVPGETGLLFIFVGMTIIFYELFDILRSKNDRDS